MRTISQAVREEARATETLAALRAHPAGPEVVVSSLGAVPAGSDVVVSTVPASAQTPELVAGCADVPVVFVVLYDPWPTPLVAAAAGRTVVGGLDLLVHQAVLQVELFTGRTVAVDVLREAGERALAARHAG